MPTGRLPTDIDLSSVDPRSIVVELPVVDEYSSTAAMLRQIRHRHPIANGYSGYTLPHQSVFEAGLRELDETTLEALQRFGPLAVVVFSESADTAPSKALLDQFRDARQTARLPTAAIYQLPERRDSIERSQDRPLPIQAIVMSGPKVDPAVLLDGNPMTLWETENGQTSGDQILITLAGSAAINRVELDLGPFPGAYPRRLRISVGSAGSFAPVWEGKTAGLALLGALESGRTVPIRIDLPAGTTGQQILLALAAEQPKISWSVSDVRVYGR